MLTAIIWKEWKEHYKWAILGALGILAALIPIIVEVSQSYFGREGVLDFFEYSTFATSAGFAVIALLLGLLQTGFDSRPHAWAFLIHRPASRYLIFTGKFIAGLGLYGVAALLPWLATVWWVSTPGNLMGPFVWKLMLPGIADFLCGIPFYLSGMLIMLREARWFGSRLLILGPAILCLLFVNLLGSFWGALLGILLTTLILLPAVWGCVVSVQTHDSQPWISRFAQGFGLLAGNFIVVCLSISVSFWFGSREFVKQISYEMDIQANPVRLTCSGGYDQIWKIEYLGSNGANSTSSTVTGSYSQVSERLANRAVWLNRNFAQWSARSYRDVDRHAAFLKWDEREFDTYHWFYVIPSGEMRAYSAKTNLIVETIPIGQKLTAPDSTLLDILSRGQIQLVFSSGLYWLDEEGRTCQQVYQPEDGSQITNVAEVPFSSSEFHDWRNVQAGYTAVLTSSYLGILDENGDLLFKTARHQAALEKPYKMGLSVSGFPGGPIVIWEESRLEPGSEESPVPTRVTKYDLSGQVLEVIELPALERLTEPSFHRPATALIPMVMSAAEMISTKSHGDDAGTGADQRPWGPGTHQFTFLMTCLVGLVCSIITYKLGNAYAWSMRRKISWIIVCLLFGVAGLMTVVALLEWPARVPCPACGKKRVVTQSNCSHCQAPFGVSGERRPLYRWQP